jgi:hypothetical protein
MIGGLLQPSYLLILIVFSLIPAVASCKIVSKTGYSGWLGLLILVPLVNLVFMLILAFTEWPIERRIRSL